LTVPLVPGGGARTFCTSGALGSGVLKGPIGQRSLPTRDVLPTLLGLVVSGAVGAAAGFSAPITLAVLPEPMTFPAAVTAAGFDSASGSALHAISTEAIRAPSLVPSGRSVERRIALTS
jgi:hypothetical protein